MRPSRKLHPWKILGLLVWGQHKESVIWHGGGRVTIRTGPWCRMISVQSARLQEYLQELQRMKYIVGLTCTRGAATFRVIPPPQDRLYGDEDRER